MKPEAQRIAIARHLGTAKDEKIPIRDFVSDYTKMEIVGYADVVKSPDYLNDLNAMHSAEKAITDYKQLYADWLRNVCARESGLCTAFEFATAPAAQRAEAFLRTMNLWKDGQ